MRRANTRYVCFDACDDCPLATHTEPVTGCGRVCGAALVRVRWRAPRLDLSGRSRRGSVVAGRARHAVVAEAARRAARARSRSTAAVAATRAAPSAIRVICQPGMPPAVTTGGRGRGGAAGRDRDHCRQAAGMMAADASRAQVSAARAAARRRSRAAACRAAVRG